MRERIIKFIESKNLSAAEFADKIGVQRSNVSHVLNGRNNPSYTFIEKIIRAFDDIDAKWLLTGIGNMIQNVEPKTAAAKKQELELPLEASAVNNSSKEIPKNEEYNDVKASTKAEIQMLDTNNDKKITRIVIFYADHTFNDYSPAQ